MTQLPPITYAGQLPSPNLPVSFSLAAGASWTVPNGIFAIRTGAQTSIQAYDPVTGLWRSLSPHPGDNATQVFSDGTNYRVINVSGTIQGVKISNAGTSYTQSTTTATFAAPASGNTAKGYPVVGGSLTFAVTTGGSGYTNPVLTVSNPVTLGGTPGYIVPAKIRATLSSGAISAITVDFAGSGYVKAPTVTITDPTGTGAVVTATVAGAGTITGFVMTNNGSGYDGTHIPAVTVTDSTGVGTSASLTALPNLSLTSVTIGGTNTSYSGTPMAISSLGAPTAILDEPVYPRPAFVTFTVSGGALSGSTIEDNGSGFQTVPVLTQLVNAGSNATLTAVVGGVNNTVIYEQIG